MSRPHPHLLFRTRSAMLRMERARPARRCLRRKRIKASSPVGANPAGLPWTHSPRPDLGTGSPPQAVPEPLVCLAHLPADPLSQLLPGRRGLRAHVPPARSPRGSWPSLPSPWLSGPRHPDDACDLRPSLKEGGSWAPQAAALQSHRGLRSVSRALLAQGAGAAGPDRHLLQ